jgi:hypothetical protein
LNIPGAGVVGSTVTGSAALRAYTSTRAFIANGNVGQLAGLLEPKPEHHGKGRRLRSETADCSRKISSL